MSSAPGEQSLGGRAALWGAVAVTVVAVGFPLYWMTASSFMPPTELFARVARLLPKAPTLQNYHELLERTAFPTYFRNSTVVAVIATVGAVALATLAGYGLTRFEFPGKTWVSRSVIFTYMFPPILLSIPLFVLLKRVGLVNSHLGLALAHMSFALPFAMWLAMIFFQALSAFLIGMQSISSTSAWAMLNPTMRCGCSMLLHTIVLRQRPRLSRK